jgi:uncharacterized protein YkwD
MLIASAVVARPAFGAVWPAVAEAQALPATSAAGRVQSMPEDRVRFLALTNGDRSAEGRRELHLARGLTRYAVKHSREMARFGHIYHSTDQQLVGALSDSDWASAGENVGVGSSLEDLQVMFMASKAHRHNILNRGFDHAAVGVVHADGSYWITVILYDSTR